MLQKRRTTNGKKKWKKEAVRDTKEKATARIRTGDHLFTVKSQIFVQYPCSLETGSCGLIFILLRASKEYTVEFQGRHNKKVSERPLDLSFWSFLTF